MNLSVCLVAPLPPPYGGISLWTSTIQRHAAGRDDVHLAVVDTAPRWRAVDDTARWRRAIGGGLQLVRDLVRLVTQLKRGADVVHLTTSGRLGAVRDLAMMACAHGFGVPVVYHLRFGRIPAIRGSQSLEWRLMARAMRRAAAVVAIDEATQLAIREHLPWVRLARIPNCFDPSILPATPPSSEAHPVVVFIGWQVQAKGIGELLEAWAQLDPQLWGLRLVGPGGERQFHELVMRHGPRNVERLGALPHPETMEILAASDVLVLPSYSEGFPNVVLEAMALGRAVVATSVGAIPEMLGGGCGLLIPPRDTAALRRALATVMSDPEARREMGAKARARAFDLYSIDRVFCKYVEAWQDARARGAGPSSATLTRR